MLVLQRKVGEEIEIGDGIRVVVLEFRGGNKVRLGVVAPADVIVDRREVGEAKRAEAARQETGREAA